MPGPDRDSLERLLNEVGADAKQVAHIDQLAIERGLVARVHLSAALPGIGSSVIAKWRGGEGDVGEFAATNLATECVALDVVARSGVDVAARVLAGGAAIGALLLSDLGSRTVESVLFGGTAAEAEAALIALGTSAARLHRLHVDPAAFAGVATWTVATRESRWDELRECVRRLGFPPVSAAAAAEYDELTQILRSPGPSATFVHGDLTPNNAVIGDDGVCRFVDFEGAGRQHVGHDMAMLRFPFAWYRRWAVVPASVQSTMEMAYRDEFGRPEQHVDEALAIGCLAMTALRLERLPRIADTTQPAELARRRRVQIANTVDVGVAAVTHLGAFPALTEWLAAMSVAIRTRWAEARGEPPIYPAFEGSTEPPS